MKKNLIFCGLGVLVSAFLLFLLKLSKSVFLGKSLNLFILFGGLALVLLGFVLVRKLTKHKWNKPLLFFGLGVLLQAVLVFLLSLVKLTNNVTLLVLFIVLSLALLIYGAVKGK